MLGHKLSWSGKAAGLVAVAISCLLTGCNGFTGSSLSEGEIPGVVIHGNVHGGANPIQQATISLMETQVGSTLNGGKASTYTSAAKVLETQTSNKYGYFTFDSNWTCTPGQYAYMTVTGGQTVTGSTNNNVIQVGVIGSCVQLNANVANINVDLSELSTVAAAYTLGNFISISPNDGSGTQQVNISAPASNLATGACTGTGTSMVCTGAGLAHGFANAINLVDSVRYDGSFPSGAANSTFVLTTNTQAVVPRAMINTLGNILQVCVDSSGVIKSSSISATSSDGSQCGTLFEYATSPYSGASSPMNTLQAMLNIAQYPTNNVDALFNLQPPNVFFVPTLASDAMSNASTTCASSASACIAYSVGIFYTGNGVANGTALNTVTNPIDVALDAADNAYILYTDVIGSKSTYGAITQFGANGLGLYADVKSNVLANPAEIALDNLGTMWATSDTSNGALLGFVASSGSLTQTLAVANNYPAGIAVGLANDIWVSRDSTDSNQSLFHFAASTSGSTTTYSSTAFNTTPALGASVKRLAVTYLQNLYGVTSSSTATAQVIRFPYASNKAATTVQTGSLGAPGGYAVAIGKIMSPTAGQEAFFPLSGEVDSANAPQTLQINSASAGSLTGIAGSGAPTGVALDGSGTLFWADNEKAGQILRLVLPTGSGSTTSTSLNRGTLTSVSPCFVTAATKYMCDLPASGTYLRGVAIDSSGAMWSVASDSDFAVMQVFGLAAPSFPLLAYGNGGVAFQ